MNAPPPATVLVERIERERQRLCTAEHVVLRRGPGADWLEDVAGPRLRMVIGNTRTRLDALSRAIERSGVDSGRLRDMAEVQHAIDRVTSECLALALGALARHFEIDEGACEQADLLIRELAERIDRDLARPTVPGEAEFLHRAADVIRRRVPDNEFWDLPIMAHEFGHVVASGPRLYDAVGDHVIEPVKTFLAGFDGYRRQQATELFCDVFATFAMGPSYPCTLVLHRLDPSAPAVADQNATHPGDAARVHACLWTLRQMQGRTRYAGPYDGVHYQLETAWQELQRDAPAEARLTDAARGALGADLAGCWVVLSDNLGVVRYQWSGRVRELADALENRRAAPVPVGYSAPDVLNAAWMVRLDRWSGNVPLPDGFEFHVRWLLDSALATWRKER